MPRALLCSLEARPWVESRLEISLKVQRSPYCTAVVSMRTPICGCCVDLAGGKQATLRELSCADSLEELQHLLAPSVRVGTPLGMQPMPWLTLCGTEAWRTCPAAHTLLDTRTESAKLGSPLKYAVHRIYHWAASSATTMSISAQQPHAVWSSFDLVTLSLGRLL